MSAEDKIELKRITITDTQSLSEEDRTYLKQYLTLRDELYHEKDKLPKDAHENPTPSGTTFILAIDKQSNRAVGGIWVAIKPSGSQRRVPFENEVMRYVENMLPGIDHKKFCYCQIGGVAVDRDFTQSQQIQGLGPALQKEALEEAERAGAEVGVSMVAGRNIDSTLRTLGANRRGNRSKSSDRKAYPDGNTYPHKIADDEPLIHTPYNPKRSEEVLKKEGFWIQREIQSHNPTVLMRLVENMERVGKRIGITKEQALKALPNKKGNQEGEIPPNQEAHPTLVTHLRDIKGTDGRSVPIMEMFYLIRPSKKTWQLFRRHQRYPEEGIFHCKEPALRASAKELYAAAAQQGLKEKAKERAETIITAEREERIAARRRKTEENESRSDVKQGDSWKEREEQAREVSKGEHIPIIRS